MTITRRGFGLLAWACLSSLLAGVPDAPGAPAVPAACDAASPPAYCRAARGDRSEGWHAQSRSEILATQGMVAASQPLAAQAGLDILRRGGNAIDAAVATAAVLNVVEPMMTGMGGDLFAIVYVAREHRLYALNASGMAPSGASLEHLQQLGFHADAQNPGPGSGMPEFGILPVTVPGAVWGWDALLKRFGTRGFREVLEPARHYAQDGFPVSERIASDWLLPDAVKGTDGATKPDPDSVHAWYVDGRPPATGTLFRNPDLAHTFELLQKQGAAAFYRGAIAQAIIAKSAALGGTMTLEDLANYRGEWRDPAVTHYHGYEVYELPPPSQDWATLEMLNLLDTCLPGWAPGKSLAELGPDSPLYWHLLVETKKLAYADLFRYNADPDAVPVPLERLLSRDHAAELCSRVDPHKASAAGRPGTGRGAGDTVVLATADREGNMVSWVSSNYDQFGSGLTVPGYGFILHNRGALFSLDPASPNVIAPHKRPYNTLSAGFVMRGGSPYMTVTLMGGDMQAQGHAQALINVFDLGANVQAASDMARFHHDQVDHKLLLESGLYDRVGAALASMGHDVHSADGSVMGGFQSIQVEQAPASPGRGESQRTYHGGSDHRKDGQAVGW